MAAEPADTLLPHLYIAHAPAIVPFYPHMQPIRPGGTAAPRSDKGPLAYHKTHLALPSVGRQRIRPCAMTRALDRFKDIHSHDRARALDGDTVVNITPAQPLREGGTYSVGIHPWDTDHPVSLSMLKKLVHAARDPRVVAIGECGFDNLRGAPADIQRRLFDLHARLAEEVAKPLVIHAVRAYPQLFDAIRRHRPSVEWIIHGYRGKPETARQLVAAGYRLSPGERHHPDITATISPEKLYNETDSPDTVVEK